MAELYHHGVLGMKWGVRRYQNYDGTRIKNDTFQLAEQNVLRNCSNNRTTLMRHNIDIETVKKRGNLTNSEAMKCSNIADKMYKSSLKAELKITNDILSSIKKSSAKMYGLQHRLKQPTSLAAKIGSDAKEKSLSFEESANKINDSIRYTTISSNKDFVKNYNSLKTDLENKGYSEIKCKNYFEKYRNGEVQHKSVTSVFESKNNTKFEIQFQTPSSQAAKELKIPIYEERRQTGNSKARNKELERQMHDLAEQVSYPKDISKIVSH